MSTRFFVTGAQGFVGRYVTSHLLTSRPDAEILGIGRSRELPDTFAHSIDWAGARVPAPLPPDLTLAARPGAYRYASLDVNARAGLAETLAAFRPHVVIHLASALRDAPAADLARTNILGTGTLMDAIADARVDGRRVIVCSTGGVYATSGGAAEPFDETSACQPSDLYSVSKLTAEYLSRALSARHGIETISARLFNVLGPGEDDRHAPAQFARQAAEIRHGLRPPVISVGDLERTRDFIDVRDAAEALSILADRGVAGAVYNVALGTESAMRSLLDLVLDAAGLRGSVEIRPRDTKGSGPRRHFADTRRLRAEGFRPRFDLARSVADVVAYYMVTVAGAAGRGHYRDGKAPEPASPRTPAARSTAMRSGE